MVDESEAQFFCDGLLERLKFWINKFNYPPRFDINQMIMMSVGRSLVARTTVPKLVPLQYTSFFKEPNSAVNRRN